MPLLIGLLLTPVGAWIGTVLFFTGMTLFAFVQPLSAREWFGALYIGTIVGSAFAAPVTVIVLPITHRALRAKRRLTARALVLAGASAGLLSVVAVVLLFWGPRNIFGDLASSAFMFLVASDGGATGAICGWLFGRITRRLRPDAWNVALGARE